MSFRNSYNLIYVHGSFFFKFIIMCNKFLCVVVRFTFAVSHIFFANFFVREYEFTRGKGQFVNIRYVEMREIDILRDF